MKQAEKLSGFLWVEVLIMTIVPEIAGCGNRLVKDNQATVTINTDMPAKMYNPMIFGGFLEHFDNQIYGGVFDPGSPLADEKGFRLDVIEALKELKVPVIRWPGGCFVDAYHWQKGVGKNRQPYGDPRWGVNEPNTFGTHEFIELCRRLGAEPYICQNGLADVQEIANIAPLVNTRGPLFVHPGGIVRRTHFHTMAMYANELEKRAGSLTIEAEKLIHGTDTVAIVDAIATVDEKGENWAIPLVNRHPSEVVACEIKLGNKLLNGKYKATVLTGDSPDTFNDIEHPDRVSPQKTDLRFNRDVTSLPPHSLIIIHVPVKSGIN